VSDVLASFSSSTNDEEDLEDFPAERLQFLDDRRHVLLPVEVADDCVQLELDPQCAAPVADAEELFDVFAGSAAYEFILMNDEVSKILPKAIFQKASNIRTYC
jgi:hypothetical protein